MPRTDDPMRLLGVAMVRDEADVIEAFVRHNLNFLDGLAIIDHCSVDGTAEILKKLQSEGLPLRIVRNPDPAYFQSRLMTVLITRYNERQARLKAGKPIPAARLHDLRHVHATTLLRALHVLTLHEQHTRTTNPATT